MNAVNFDVTASSSDLNERLDFLQSERVRISKWIKENPYDPSDIKDMQERLEEIDKEVSEIREALYFKVPELKRKKDLMAAMLGISYRPSTFTVPLGMNSFARETFEKLMTSTSLLNVYDTEIPEAAIFLIESVGFDRRANLDFELGTPFKVWQRKSPAYTIMFQYGTSPEHQNLTKILAFKGNKIFKDLK